MTNPVIETKWYQCKACRNFVTCAMRLDAGVMAKVKEQGDCSRYVFSCTTRWRTTFQ